LEIIVIIQQQISTTVQAVQAIRNGKQLAEDMPLVEESRQFAEAWQHYRQASAGPHEYLLYPKLLQRLNPLAGQVVLDAGCGEGSFLSHLLRQKPSQLLACDINPELLNIVRSRYGHQVDLFQQDLSTPLKLSSNTCDKLLSSCVLMHLDQTGLRHVAHEFARVLRPSGEAVISVVHYKWAQQMYTLAETTDGTLATCKHKGSVSFTEWYRPGNVLKRAFEQAGFNLLHREDVIIPANAPLPERYRSQAGSPLFELFHLVKR
jgi:ubiquinone/menaquinone biosynthesis C-methylase UbiE